MIEGPAGLPRDVVTKLNIAIVAVVKSPQTKADHARWGAVVMKLGLQVDGF